MCFMVGHVVLELLRQITSFEMALSEQPVGKWYMSEEAHWEVQGLQRYVAALAQHDIRVGPPVHLRASLGLPDELRPSNNSQMTL